MGWLVTILGILLIAIGTFFTFYGQHLVRQPERPTSSSPSAVQEKLLTPVQEKLLRLIYNYQTELGQNKLIISRSDGRLHFDEEEKRKKYQINLFAELFGIDSNFEEREDEFEALILGISDTYLRSIPEARMNNPYVVQITEGGISYLRNH